MEIIRLSLLEGARRARGTAIVIDVFRAFTTAAYAMGGGVERIIPVATSEEAFQLKRLHPDWLLVGESHGVKIRGFDYGNSPSEVAMADLRGRTVVLRTSSGVQGILSAEGADEVLLGSFVIAEATVDYIRARGAEVVSLVAMGWEGSRKTLEDELCADYIEARLRCERHDFSEMRSQNRADPQGAKFFDSHQSHFTPADFEAAMRLDRFDFALRFERGDPPKVVRVDR